MILSVGSGYSTPDEILLGGKVDHLLAPLHVKDFHKSAMESSKLMTHSKGKYSIQFYSCHRAQ